MKKFGLAGIVLMLALLAAAAVTQAATWNVPAFFATIQAANDSPLVNNGDTIQVGEGYFEFPSTFITKSLTIKGSGVGKTIMATYSPVFWLINQVNVRITNLTIMGQPADPLGYGIIILNGSGNTVDHCAIQYCTVGIWIFGGTNHKITNNTIRWNSCLYDYGGAEGVGIYLQSDTGYILTNTGVQANHIYDNDGDGVVVNANKAVNASVDGVKIMSNFFANNFAQNACSVGGINYNLESINLWYNSGAVTISNNKFLYPIEDGPGSVIGDWHNAPGALVKSGNKVYYNNKISFSGPYDALP